MAERCAGCMNKFKFREKPAACVKCHRNFCSLCIPVAKHKKKTPVIRDTCIYCTRRLQEAMKEQEAEVLEQFPDRFYHSPHVQPTLHTKVRLDEGKLNASGGRSGGEPRLTDEDRKLEERFRKLKESRVPTTQASSETVLHARLAKLREDPHNKNRSEETDEKPPSSLDNQPQPNGGLPQPSNKTQAEQADDLVDQVSDMVKLDAKVDQSSQHLNVEDSVNTFLSGLEVQIEDEDPNKLLEDFKKFQLKEEHKALAEATSHEVQAMVEKAKELQQQEEDESGEGKSEAFITPYPQLPHSMETQVLEEDKISQVEIMKVLEAAKKEMEQEEKEQKDIDQFISEASKQLSDLRGNGRVEIESDCEVRSKLEHRQEPLHRLDFSWDHFGASGGMSNLELPTDSGLKETAAHQLGITLSGSSGEWDDGDEVAGLIEQTMAEVALDSKLEEKGLDTYLDVPGKAAVSSKSSEKGGATASGVGGACAATNYPTTSGWEVDPDDLPWCCICNSDAHIRCFDCDNDLYCTQCFSEGHEQFGLFDHKYAPFDPSSSRVV